MKDSLKTFMSPVDDSLRHLYYMYKDSSKKLGQLKTAVLQGKLNALTQASVILRSALLTDILEPAKNLSLISQKE